MYYYSSHKCMSITFFLIITNVSTKSIKLLNISEDLISDLYLKYKEAAEDDSPNSSRRLFTQNRQYRIHVRKLKEVNGLKTHNLMIKEVDTESNPLIYIDNPVEAKFPNAYLSLEEFKEALINRVQVQRQSLTTSSKLPLRTQKETELLTTKLLPKKNTKYIQSKISNKKISLTKPYSNPVVRSRESKLTFITSRNITKIIKSSLLFSTSTITTPAVIKESPKEETKRNTKLLENYIQITTEVSTSKETVLASALETFKSTDSGRLNEQSKGSITEEAFTEEEKNATEISSNATEEETTEEDKTTTDTSSNALEDFTEKQTTEEEKTTTEASSNASEDFTEEQTTEEEKTTTDTTSNIPEDFTEEQTIEEEKTTTETSSTVVTEATRKTRRTLGRPLVFMGSNK